MKHPTPEQRATADRNIQSTIRRINEVRLAMSKPKTKKTTTKTTAVVVTPRTDPSNIRPKIDTQVAPPVPAMSPYIRVFGAADPLEKFKDKTIKSVIQHLKTKSIDDLLDILFKRLRLNDRNSALHGLWDQFVLALPEDIDTNKEGAGAVKKVLIYETIAAGLVNGNKLKVKNVIERLIQKFRKVNMK